MLPWWEHPHGTLSLMRIIAKSSLDAYSREHAEARPSLEDWHAMARAASWSSMSDIVKHAFGRPSPVGASRVVFNIHHNAHRLIVDVDFTRQLLFIKFIGTHAEYDAIDPRTVSRY